ncbi:trypsin-like serine protease [bacterium]|nr:trypsin-like serine protease [bacterium]
MKKLKLFTALTLAITTHISHGFINGGVQVKMDDPIAQSTVAIGSQQRGFHCSASILSDELLLTAAHCVNRIPVDTVYFGLDVNVETTTREVTGIVAHPDFERPSEESGYSDIAVLKFTGGLPEGYSPIEIAPEEYEILQGDQLVLAGFGQSIESGLGILRKIGRTVLEPIIFGKEIAFLQDEENGACFGDSGGPALFDGPNGLLLAGVASRVGNSDCGDYAIYTRPQNHMDFILGAASELLENKINLSFIERIH